MVKVRPTCCLAFSEGEKPKTATYTCECGHNFEGLKAWREHMIARSQLRKREAEPPIGRAWRAARPSLRRECPFRPRRARCDSLRHPTA